MRRAVEAAQPVGAVTVRPAKHSLVELEAAAAKIDAAITPRLVVTSKRLAFARTAADSIS